MTVLTEPRIHPDLWGRDHRSTLLYIETRCVDHSGRLASESMRTNRQRHPLLGGRLTPGIIAATEYPTRLAGDVEEHAHDDWDCVLDMHDVGYLRILEPRPVDYYFRVEPGRRGPIKTSEGTVGGLVVVRVKLLDLGWQMAHRLRRERAERALAR